MSTELLGDEKLISYIAAPNLSSRRRIIFALIPPFVSATFVVLVVLNDRQNLLAGAATAFLLIALFVDTLRRCRTSYFISTKRLIRFVGGKKIEEVDLAESTQPVQLDFASNGYVIVRWTARFFSLGPVVEVRRLKPKPWTFAAFVTSRDLSRMRVGYPGHSLPISKIFDDVTRVWEAAGNVLDGGDKGPDLLRISKAGRQESPSDTASP